MSFDNEDALIASPRMEQLLPSGALNPPFQLTANGKDELAIALSDVSKCYLIYGRPEDRLKQFVLPRLQRLVRTEPKVYHREFWALQGISFAVRKGESIGVVGRNGAGKSTLLQVICGTTHPTSGSVAVTGRVAALLELGSGFNPEFSGRDNVYLYAGVLGLSRKEVDVRFDSIAAFADIGEFIDQPVKVYSTGMAVRLAFAVIAHVDADILIIDEALAVGDIAFQAKCMRHIHGFRERGGTLFFVSHDVNSVKSLCERAIYLKQGSVHTFGPAAHVCEQYLAETNCDEGLAQPAPTASSTRAPLDQPTMDRFRSSVAAFRRHKAHKCEIIGVHIIDSGQRPVHIAEYGAELTIRVHVLVHAALDELVVAFYVQNKLQVNLLGTNTAYEGLDLGRLTGGQRISIDFSFRNLLCGGEYGICVIAADRAPWTTQFFDWIDFAASYRVSDRPGRTAWAIFNPGISVAAEHAREVD